MNLLYYKLHLTVYENMVTFRSGYRSVFAGSRYTFQLLSFVFVLSLTAVSMVGLYRLVSKAV